MTLNDVMVVVMRYFTEKGKYHIWSNYIKIVKVISYCLLQK